MSHRLLVWLVMILLVLQGIQIAQLAYHFLHTRDYISAQRETNARIEARMFVLESIAQEAIDENNRIKQAIDRINQLLGIPNEPNEPNK